MKGTTALAGGSAADALAARSDPQSLLCSPTEGGGRSGQRVLRLEPARPVCLKTS